jgi:hypothetical protein
MSSLVLNIILCCVLIAITVGVSLYRKWLEDHCDHYIHLHNDSHDATVVSSQADLCKRLETMDKLKTGLIVAVVVYAIAIAGYAVYGAWTASGMSS